MVSDARTGLAAKPAVAGFGAHAPLVDPSSGFRGLLGLVHIDSCAGQAHSDESEISVNGSRTGRRPM
jgi:hypothetical protein